jgi:hypothetical protein
MTGVDGLAVAPVVPLDDVPDGAIAIAGYKATRLAELARHGFLVPPIVVVMTALDTFEAEEHSAVLHPCPRRGLLRQPAEHGRWLGRTRTRRNGRLG